MTMCNTLHDTSLCLELWIKLRWVKPHANQEIKFKHHVIPTMLSLYILFRSVTKMWKILSLCLIVSIVTCQTVNPTLTTRQTLSAISGSASQTPVNIVKYSLDSKTLAAAIDKTIYFYIYNTGTTQWGSVYSILLQGSVIAMDFSISSNTASAITSSPDKVNFFVRNAQTNRYQLNQSIAVSPTPKSISYIGLGETSVVGFSNGNIQTYKMKLTNGVGVWTPIQSLVSGFSSIGASSAYQSRYAVCDSSSGKVRVYYWNYTTGLLEGNDATITRSAPGCSAIILSPDNNRIAIGNTDGTVQRLIRNGDNTYSLASINPTKTAGNTQIDSIIYDTLSHFLFTCNNKEVYSHNMDAAGTAFNSISHPHASLSCRALSYNFQINQAAVGYSNGVGGVVETKTITVTCPVVTGYGTTVAGSDKCTCSTGYFWYDGGCRRINCFQDPYRATSVTVNPTYATTSGCSCVTGFVWSSTIYQCIRDCTVTTNAMVNRTNYEINSCYCDTQYTWDRTNSVCSSYLDCSLIPSSTGVNIDYATCACGAGTYFNKATKVCSSAVVNCSNYEKTNGQATSTSCKCLTGFYWHDGDQRCRVDCKNMPYSAGQIKDTIYRCNCVSRARWDLLLSQCVANYHQVNPAAIVVPIVVPLVVLAIVGALLWLFCCRSIPPPPPYRGPPPMYPVPRPAAIYQQPSVYQQNPSSYRLQQQRNFSEIIQPVQAVQTRPNIHNIIAPTR